MQEDPPHKFTWISSLVSWILWNVFIYLNWWLNRFLNHQQFERRSELRSFIFTETKEEKHNSSIFDHVSRWVSASTSMLFNSAIRQPKRTSAGVQRNMALSRLAKDAESHLECLGEQLLNFLSRKKQTNIFCWALNVGLTWCNEFLYLSVFKPGFGIL